MEEYLLNDVDNKSINYDYEMEKKFKYEMDNMELLNDSIDSQS
jgi:hypothetical protein